MKILDRYIVSELLFPFFTGTAVFTLLFLSMDTLFRVANLLVKGAHLADAFQYLWATIPSVLVLTFPMAVLLACLLAFGRLSSDSELTAIKAGGISFLRVAMPGIALTLAISLFSYLLNEEIVPDATYRAHNFLIDEYTSKLQENITVKDGTPDGGERRLFARKLDKDLGIMYDVTIQSFEHNVRTREVYAERVVWENNRWIMYRVHTYDYNPQQDVTIDTLSDAMVLALNQGPKDIAKRDRLPEEMSQRDLRDKIDIMASARNAPKDSTYNHYVLIYHEKMAIPCTCFVFGMLGMPLGVRPQRTSPSVGLGISLIFILFYYVLMTVAHALGENSFLPAGMAAWLPNIVFGILGVFLVYRASRT